MDRRSKSDPYKHLFETMLDGAAVVDAATGQFVLANHAAARMFGFASPEEMAGQNPLDYVPAEDRGQVARIMAEGFERHRGSPTEIRIRTKQGRLLWVSASVSLMEYEGRKAALTTMRDMTSEKARDAALREAEHQYEGLFDGMIDGAVVLDISTFRIALANKAAAEMFGFESSRDIIGDDPLRYIPEEDRDEVARMIALNLEGKGKNPAEIRVITSDKRQIWVSASASKIEYEGRTATLTTLRDITADKAKDAALKAAEDSRLLLMDAASESIVVVQDGKIAYVNPAAAREAGISREQMTGIPFLEFVHPDQKQAMVERYNRSAAGQLVSGPTQVKGVDGRGNARWSEIQDIPFQWQGKPAVMSLVTDITDKVRMQEELREREERLRAVIENAWDGITILDENYNVTFESPSLARISGYTPEEWLGRTPDQMLLHPDDLPPLLAKIQTLKSQPGSVIRDVVVRYQHKDGSWRWIEATGHNLLNDPKVKGLVVNFRDITDRLKMQESLKNSEERFRTLIEKATDVVIVLDAGGKIIYQSPSLERVTGYGPGEWVDKSLDELFIHPDDLPSLASLLEQVLTQPGGTFEGVCARYRRKDGSWHVLEATVTNMLHDPKVNGIVANFRDVTDRKQAQQALADNEQKFRLLVENANDLIFSLDAQGNFTYASPAIERISGYRVDEVIGSSFVRFVFPEDLPGLTASFERTLGGVSEPSEFRAVVKEGAIRYVQTTSRLVMRDGKVVGLTGIMSDITERKQAELALRETRERYRALFDRSVDSVYVHDFEGNLLDANDAALNLLGYDREDIAHLNFGSLLTEDQIPTALAALDELKETGTQKRMTEYALRRKNGKLVYVETVASVIRHEGKPYAIQGIARDVTERRKAEQALRESEEKYRLLAEKTNDVIWITDLNLRTTYVSPSVERILGFRPAERLMQDATQQMTPESFARAAETLAHHLALEEDPKADPNRTLRIELEYYHKNGSTLWLESQVSGIRDANGTLIGFHGVGRDIAERKRAARALKESDEKNRLLIDNATEGIAVVQDGVLKFTNPRFAESVGYSAQELVDKSFAEFIHPDDRQRVAEYYLKRLSGEEAPSSYQFRWVDREAVVHSGEASVANLEWEGRPATLCMLSDITERKKALEALAASEAKYKDLFEQTLLGMEVVDAKTGKVILANHALAKMFGFESPQEMVGIDAITGWVMPEDMDWVLRRFAQVLANPERRDVATLMVKGEDGRVVWVSGSGTFFDYEGKPAILISLVDVTAAREAELKLHDSEEKYRLVAESTNDEIWTSDINLNTTYVSPSVERLLGFTVEERMKQDVMSQMTPESFARAAEALAHHLALEKDPNADPNRILRIELEYYRKDGSTVWLENHVGGIRDANGTLIGFHGVARDVTERRKAEQALKESEERYRLLAENASDIIWVTNADLKVTYASPSATSLLGYSLEELSARSFDSLLTPDSMALVTGVYKDALAQEKTTPGSMRDVTMQMEVRCKGGSTVWLETAINVIRDGEGRFAGFQGACRDISERRRAQEALKASEERFRTLIEESTDAITILDGSGNLLYESPSMERITGYRLDDWQGTPVGDWLIHPDDMGMLATTMEQVLREPNATVENLTTRFKHKDGTWHILEATVRNLLHDPKVSGLVVNYRDVTERKQAEEALSQKTEELDGFFSVALDLLCIAHMDGRFHLLNRAWETTLGHTREELMAGRFFDFVHPEDVKSTEEAVARLASGQEVINFSNRYRCRDGSYRWLEWRSAPSGNMIYAAARDITEEKKIQEALAASEAKYKDLFDHTLLGMEVVDAQTGKVVLANRSLAHMFGFKSVADMIGTKPLDYILPEDLEFVANQIAQLMTDSSWDKKAVIRSRTEDGRLIWVTGMAAPFEYEGKLGMLISLVDVTAAKDSELKLQESEEKNRLLIDNAAEAIAVIQNGATKFFNARLAELTGYTPEELQKISLLDLVHPEERESIALNYMMRVAGQEVPNNYQFRIIDKTGQTKWLQVNAIRFNWEGKPASLTMFSDVTERVKAEQAVRDSEERFRALIEKATDAIAIVDAQGKIVYYSPSIERATGYESGDWMSRSLGDWKLHPDDLAALAPIFDALLKEPGKIMEGLKVRYEHIDGTWHTLEATVRNLLHDPKVNGLVANFRDVTERVKAEESLRNSEERFRGLVETSSDWVWEVDRSARYTYVSPKVRDILGYEPEEILGHTPYDFMHQREGRRVSKIMKRFAAERLPFSLLENTCTHKDGRSVVLETSAVPILDADGTLLGYRGIDRDITERKKVEQELQRSLKRLEKTMDSTIEAITTTIETRDPYTTGHQMRVTDLACTIAKILEIPPTQIEGIRVAGLLHDIGKIAIPTEILSKPGKLNEVEYEMIKTHAKVGYNILKKIDFPWPVAKAVLQHHERWNGSGYPHGLRGEDILIEARILAVADVMEAMSSHRPYRPSIGSDKALDEIVSNSGILYDPAVAKACIKAFTEAGFKFASSQPGASAESETAPSDRPAHLRENN